MIYNEIRNILGIYDDDLLNAACECERKEDLAEKIANKIVKFHGFHKGLYNGDVFKFGYVKEILEDFGFKYEKSDDDLECHYFKNKDNGYEISIYPVTYYPNQDAFRFLNFLLY